LALALLTLPEKVRAAGRAGQAGCSPRRRSGRVPLGCDPLINSGALLDLLVELQTDAALTYLFISRDLAVVRKIAHHVGVMRDGQLLELAPTEQLFEAPGNDYTRELLAAIAGQRRPTRAKETV
jgi:ABC-type dipeptide/oligopeptide/nickel transport system ATPase component